MKHTFAIILLTITLLLAALSSGFAFQARNNAMQAMLAAQQMAAAQAGKGHPCNNANGLQGGD